jgi:hypothetical protein
MEGFNPDQSLIPSVGGSITAMSGGGQEGGLTLANGTQSVLGSTKWVDLKKYESILQKLSPTVVNTQIIDGKFWEKINTDKKADDTLKEDILKTVLNDEYVPHMQITVESDKDGAITEANIQEALETLATSIDIDLVTIILDDTGLTIRIGPGATASEKTTGGYETLEAAAKAAAEEALNAEMREDSLGVSSDSENE